jgi:predicted dehydrogenase
MDALIVGFGSIGCRHAQSLLSVRRYGAIHIVEPSDQKFEEGVARIGATGNDVVRYRSLEEFHKKVDVAIVATSSAPRFEIMRHLLANSIPLLLVEKIVFQSLLQFDEIITLLEKSGARAYCNFTNRYFSNYRHLKESLSARTLPLAMTVTGGDLGLGSNAIHYMDLFEYLTGEPIIGANSDLSKWDRENKRGSVYSEFSGLIAAQSRRGDSLLICFDPSHQGGAVLHLHFEDRMVILSEGTGIEMVIHEGTTTKQPFTIIPSSRLTHRIVEDMANNTCPLTTLVETRNAHRFLFTEVYKALNLPNKEGTLCPIT